MSLAPASFRLSDDALGARVWVVDLDAAPVEDSAGLSVSEQVRAQRFVFDRDRRRYVAAHRALRAVLTEEAGLGPGEEFILGPNGKPSLSRGGAASFNLSHSGEWAVIAVAHGADIGVDVEVPRSMDDLDELAQQHFGAAELRELYRTSDPGDRLAAFFRGWTRKEACLKAIGSGLTIQPASFHVGLGSGTQPVAIDTAIGPRRVDVVSFEVAAGILAALARVALP
jgi:4'-phosphopantetheinyl transferase